MRTLRRTEPMRHLLLAAHLLVPALTAQTHWALYPAQTAPTQVPDGMTFVGRCGCVVGYGGYVTSEMWSWDGFDWTLLDPAPPPGARWGHGMSHDSRRGTLLVFGGGSGYHRNDTWEWDGAAWVQHQPATAPSGRFRMPMAYDEARDVHVVFGGEGPGTTLDDTWEWNGTTWAQRSFGVRPAARLGHGLAYDRVRRELVLFGGITTPGGTSFDDTWTYDGTAWRRRTPATVPPARALHVLAWDDHRGRIVLHAGNSRPWATNDVGLTDTWEWDGTDWQQRLPATAPATGGRFAYDPQLRVTVMTRGAPAETWYYFPLQPADVRGFGAGCASAGGSGPTPTIDAAPQPANLPWLGATFTTEMRDVPPGGQPLLVFGLSRAQWAGAALPVALAPFGGGPGCALQVGADLVLPMPSSGGARAELPIAIPNLPAWAGTTIHVQGLVLEAPSSPARLTATGGLTLRIGSR